MATLELDLDRCIAFHDVECGVCARPAPIGEAALALDEGGRPVLKGRGMPWDAACACRCASPRHRLSRCTISRIADGRAVSCREAVGL